MSDPAKTIDQNILPVQALFNLDNSFNTFIGQGQPFFATLNPNQSGLSITNSTIDSTTIGATTPSTGVFTNILTTTGQVTTTPVNSTDIANKFYVDSIAQGLSPKQAVKCATTANITLYGLQTIDAYNTLNGDRVLVKNQTTQSQNGIWIASSGSWVRSTDMDVWSEVPGAYMVVLYGTINGNTGWVSTSADTGTINVTPITFVQFTANGTYTAGTGLSLSSNQFSITNTGVTAGSYGSASQSLSAIVNAQGQLTSLFAQPIAIANTQVSGLGTLSTQNANNVSITGGSITSTPISGSTVSGTTITASTQFSGPATGLTGSAASLSIGGNAATATFATSAGSASSATTATTATNLAGGATNSIPYQSGASTTTFLASGTGVLQSNSGLAWTTTPSLVGTNFSSIPNSALTNSSLTIGTTNIPLGSTASTLTSVTMATPTISSYETYTASSAPSYNAGRLWYDSNQNSLAYYNDVTNNTLHIGEEIQLKVYNNTGSTINVGQPVYVTSTSSGFTYPNVALAIANSLATSNVIGLANQAIPTGTAGYVTTIGLIQGVNTGTYTVGDTLYLSPYSAGFYQNTIPPTGYAVKLGTVAYVNSSTGSIYVNKSILSVQAGNIVGQVSLANGGTSANLTAVAGGVVYSSASALAISASGTAGQYLQSNGTGAPSWNTVTASVGISDDTSSATAYYPLFSRVTSGTTATEYTSSTKLLYTPSSGTLAATVFSGSGASLTSIPNGALTNSSVTIGSTNISLGSTATTLAGLSSVTSTSFVGALTGNADTATTTTTATNATNTAITDNTSSVATWYPTIVSTTTGNLPITTSSTKLSFVTNTGTLSSTSLIGGLGLANYGQLSGGATGKAVQFQTLGSDGNVSLAIQPKGTGAIDLAAGSSGVNISNGGTVTAVTRTAAGTSYTSAPTWSASAPTTAGGVTATGTTYLALQTLPTITSGGTGYTVGDTLTFVGGSGITIATTLSVSTVSSGVITAVTIAANGAYATPPTSPISVTGGTGTGATFTTTAWGVASTIVIGNAGSGYIEQPTITFSGGGGSGATAYASIGAGSIIRALGTALNFNTSAGQGFGIVDNGQSTVNFWGARGGATGNSPNLTAYSTTSIPCTIDNGQAQSINFRTNTNVTQAVVSHTASAVNYVQVTGSATGSRPTISTQGSDATLGLTISTKGSGNILFFSQGGTNQSFQITTGGGANFLNVTPASAGSSPILGVLGTDANIDLALTPKGTTGGVAINSAIKLGAGASAGTSGQVLTSAGAGASPTWSAVGGMTLLGTITTTSGTSASLTGLTLTGYKQLQCQLNGASVSGTYYIHLNGNRIMAANSTNMYGTVLIDLTTGWFSANTGDGSGTGSSATFVNISGLTTASTSITFTTSSGTFDNGSILVYGIT